MDNVGDKDLQPSSCTSDYWIWADNKTSINNLKPTDESCGKWLVFEPLGTVDEAWKKIKEATEGGQLGFRAKVGTMKHKDPNDSAHATTVICIHTYDWTDEADVMRVREALRNLGFTKKLPYKTDADTYAGKYSSNGHKRISKYYC